MRRLTRALLGALLLLLSTPSARAATVRDGSFSVDLGPDVCIVRPPSLRTPEACATFEPDKIPVGPMDAPGVTALVFGVFPIGLGPGRRMGAVTVVRDTDMAHTTEPTLASATRHFELVASQMAATVSSPRPLQLHDVRVERINGLAVARCELSIDDPARAEALLARLAVSLVYTEHGLYTITISTPQSGASTADQVRDRMFASLQGEPPRASFLSELGSIARKSALWIVGTIALIFLVRHFARRGARASSP